MKIEERLRVEAPPGGVVPDRNVCLDYADAGAVRTR